MNTSTSKLRRKRLLAFMAMVGLTISGILGFLYYTGFFVVKKDMIAVINIEGAILLSRQASRYLELINEAITNDTVKAVVLRVDSPGGYADLVEQIYLDLLELGETKPLVASVSFALSGGYYIAVAAEYIYVSPTSFIGNIGVIGIMPPTLIPSEIVLETGVHKVTGFSKLLFPFNLTRALNNFVSAVENSRGERLKLSSIELKRGMIYSGVEAIEVGLADEVGSLQKAIERAAEEAGIVEYEIVDLAEALRARQPLTGFNLKNTTLDWRNLTVETLNRLQPPPSVWYLYLPTEAFVYTALPAEEKIDEEGYAFGEGRGLVLVDKSHGNKISTWELDVLIAELAKRNITVRFVSNWDELESMLENASCLIIASPTESYSTEEGDRIERFIGDGRMLLLFYDPAAEYLELPALFSPINSISTRFGLFFAKGYLYNEVEHYGFYRNIYVKSFANVSLTQNLTTLVFFTAAHIHSPDKGVAWASNGTYSSTAERSGNYTVIAIVERNGTVMAFGDMSFLREPYSYVEDNYKLVLNIVAAIARVRIKPEKPIEEVEEVKEITEPELPVGTIKEFTEWVNGEEHTVKWVKVSEYEVVVERPNMTTRYFYDEDGALVKWTSDTMEATYDDPIPPPPYPLTEGEGWRVESNYTLRIGENKTRGVFTGEFEVVDLQDVEAGDGKTYFCAKIRYETLDVFEMEGREVRILAEGYIWVSSEVGKVKEESIVRYYLDGVPVREVNVKMLLKSIRKG